MESEILINSYFEPMRQAFEENADPKIAAGAKAYMRNLSEFYGIPSPLRRELLSTFISHFGFPQANQTEALVYFSWNQPQREWQYVCMEILEKMARKSDVHFLDLCEWLIIHKSWWDTVDFIAPNIAGMFFRKNQELKMVYLEKWMQTGNLWLQRSCLLHQLRYKKDTDSELLFSLCKRLASHPDFFIRKAIGWSLREYSKVNPAAVTSFVQNHTLSGLSRKEAMKVINKKAGK